MLSRDILPVQGNMLGVQFPEMAQELTRVSEFFVKV